MIDGGPNEGGQASNSCVLIEKYLTEGTKIGFSRACGHLG